MFLGTAPRLDHRDALCTEGARVRLVGRHFHAHERLQWDLQTSGIRTAIDDRRDPHHARARAFRGVDGLACREPGRDHVLDDDDAIGWREREAATQRQLAVLPFREDRAQVHRAADFLPDHDAAKSGREDHGRLQMLEARGKRTPQLFGEVRVLQHERALQVPIAVKPRRKLEVPFEQCTGLPEEIKNFVICHLSSGEYRPSNANPSGRFPRTPSLAPLAGARCPAPFRSRHGVVLDGGAVKPLRRCSSNNLRIRLYSSAQLDARSKPWFSTGYGASSQFSLRSSMRRCASRTESWNRTFVSTMP